MEFKRQLKIVFAGEEGIDEGGVQKEFFQLLIEQLYDPDYGMFHLNVETRCYWFNTCSFENNLQYELFGILLGMAIYNNVLLDIHFPKIIYQKLCDGRADGFVESTIDDLIEFDRTLGKSLMALLKYDEDDLQDVFCLNFSKEIEFFGVTKVIPLQEGGEHIQVTQENKVEYVDLYIHYVFNTSVQSQFLSFRKGFPFSLTLFPYFLLLEPGF